MMNNQEKPYIIAVDFDGTLCENKYPEIGKPKTEMIRYLKKRQNDGAKLILWTCRLDDRLKEAVDWCNKEHGLIFDAVNQNLPEIIKQFGGDARKIFANEYIDDRNTSFVSPYEFPEWIYASTRNLIWDNTFAKIEEALGFKLFIWQKYYIMGLGYRMSGQTTAEVLKELFDPFDNTYPIRLKHDLRMSRKERNLQSVLLDIKKKLDAAGVYTRDVEMEK